jgi:LPS O-antigen subunit length determinant protein (WzzB/FepE family)
MEELNLRDYLRVIWIRKWVILGVFLISIVAAGLYSSQLANKYEATAQVLFIGQPQVQSLYPIWSTSNRLILPNDDQLDVPSSKEVEQIFAGFRSANSSIATNSVNDVINLRMTGTQEPQVLAGELSSLIDSVKLTLNENLQASINLGIDSLRRGQEHFESERDAVIEEIRGWLDQRIAGLEQKESELITTVEANSSSPEGVQYAVAFAQLQAVESELIRLIGERESEFLQPGLGLDIQLAEFDQNLQALKLSIKDYEYLRGLNWDPLLIQHEPKAFDSPIGPSRMMTILIAGILGLFLGLLLAFFLHFVQAPPSSPRAKG